MELKALDVIFLTEIFFLNLKCEQTRSFNNNSNNEIDSEFLNTNNLKPTISTSATSGNNTMKQQDQLLVNINTNHLKVDSFKLPLYNDKNEAVFTNNNESWDVKKHKNNSILLR